MALCACVSIVTVRSLPARVKARVTKRCSLSVWCVVAPGRISATILIAAACGVVITKVEP